MVLIKKSGNYSELIKRVLILRQWQEIVQIIQLINNEICKNLTIKNNSKR